MPDKTFDPDWCVHPGQTLAELLEEKSLSTAALASRTGRSVEQIENIVNGRSLYSADFALALERAFANGPDAEFWMRLRSGYELGLAKGRTPS